MFGLQRTMATSSGQPATSAPLASWIGVTAGRTTLNGEGLQHGMAASLILSPIWYQTGGRLTRPSSREVAPCRTGTAYRRMYQEQKMSSTT